VPDRRIDRRRPERRRGCRRPRLSERHYWLLTNERDRQQGSLRGAVDLQRALSSAFASER
jgi:hypothetical protein